MKQDQPGSGQGASTSMQSRPLSRRDGPSSRAGSSAPSIRRVPVKVLIRPARPDDLEEATLVERRVWGRMAVTLNELQRRLFAFPEAFLLAELRRPGGRSQVVGLTTGLIWTRDYSRSFSEYQSASPSGSHNPRGDVLYIVSLGVDPALRGRGIGLGLLQEATEVARRRHLKYCRTIANSRCESLCERGRFRVVRSLPRLFRHQRDLMPRPVLMELSLL